MKNVIANAEQVTPEWLTATLREQGVLPRGTVTRVTPGDAQTTFASSVWRLVIEYTADATPGAPRRLFLKASHPALAPGEFDPEQLRREPVFYHAIAPAMDRSLTIPCYDVAYEAETGASHILLEDVAETHVPCSTPPSQSNYESAVDVLARLHACWWDHPRLGKDVGRYPTHEERRQEWADAEKSTTAFLAACDDRLAASWRAAYESVLPALPVLYGRHATGRNLTLVHGDAHLGNVLFPRDAGPDGTYLIDWQFWHPTIGGTDLAFMLVTESEVESRRRLERPLLQRYHRALLAHGVRGYTLDDCWNDYRLSVILVSVFIPVWRWALFTWEPDMVALERGMTAYEELGCSDLLAMTWG